MFLANLRRLLRIYLENRKSFAIAAASALVVIGLAAVQPLLIREAINRSVQQMEPEILLNFVAALIAVSAVKGVAINIRRRYALGLSVKGEGRLRGMLYEHVQALDLAYHERMPTGQLMSRATSDLQAIRDFLSLIPISIGMSTFLLVVTGILISMDPLLTLVALLPLPFMAIGATRLTQKLHPIVYQTQQHLAELTAVAEETVTGIRVVKAFGREALQVERLAGDAGNVFGQASEAIRIRAKLHPLLEGAPALSLAIVLWLGGYRVINEGLPFGDFVAFFVYITQLAWPVRLMGWLATDAQRAATASGRIYEVLDTKPGIEDRPAAKELSVPAGEIRFENVSFVTPSGSVLLNGMDFTIPPGTSLALVGPTGCGKSTVLRLMLRFFEPTDSRILVDGQNVSDVTLESLRAQIGTVFEETFLFSDTIRNNIAFGRPGASEEEIVTAAALAQAHGFIDELPDGYETVVGEQGYTLSGGQRQRIAIARAILMNPKILLLDDATSSVDPRVESDIRRGLAEAMGGRTAIIVARRPGSAALADRVAYMEQGSIVATGTHDELWRSLAAYRETLAGKVEPRWEVTAG